MDIRRRNRRSDRSENQGKYMTGIAVAGAVIAIIWIAFKLFIALVTRD